MSQDEIQVVRSEVCRSISDRGNVSYQIGTLGDRQFIKLGTSDNGGLCCRDWLDLVDVKKLLSGNPNPTSRILKPLYQNKSSNSPGFLLAALINEKMCAAKTSGTDSEPSPSKLAKKQKKEDKS